VFVAAFVRLFHLARGHGPSLPASHFDAHLLTSVAPSLSVVARMYNGSRQTVRLSAMFKQFLFHAAVHKGDSSAIQTDGYCDLL